MKKHKKLVNNILLIVVLLVLITPSFVFKRFGRLDLEQIIFLFVSDGAGADLSVFGDYFKFAIPIVLIAFALIHIVKYFSNKYHDKLIQIKGMRKIKETFENPTFLKITFSKGIILTAVLALFLNQQFDVSGFIANSKDITYIYEENYVHPDSVKLDFPEEKRNLVHIFLESMNTNYSAIELEEGVVNLIPNIEQLSKENVSFTNSQDFGGFQHLRGLTWTVASLVGQTSGVPLNVPMKRNKYGKNGFFLPGIKSFGEILDENGYDNYFLMGSDGNFGGRETYFTTHGNYTIYDTKYLKEIGYIDEDYDVFWGMEDLKLFDVAKTKLTEVASKGEPFNFSMLTVDSHYPEGYVNETCDLPYENTYANAITCSDLKIIEFVKWIQAQDFYENTTIILSGDHNTMNDEFLNKTLGETKTIYNTFINLPMGVEDVNLTDREFSALDMFPTTLAALGVNIEGNRLGLGVNMFSDKKTLIERMGVEVIDLEFGKTSNYYNENFFFKNGEPTE